MKNILYLLCTLLGLTFISCEEEVQLNFDEHTPRLVIDGNVFVGEEDFVRIKLSTTTDFYANVFPKVDNANVSIKDLNTNQTYTLSNTGEGNFITADLKPEMGTTYELMVVYKNETYKATSTLLTSPEVISVDQVNDGGIMGDSYEFRFNFQDNANEQNYYLIQMISPIDHFFGVTDDQFTNGNVMNDLYFYDKEDIKAGDELHHALNSVSKDYYNYLSKLLSISGESNNPFASPMGTIKGNIVNQTNEKNYALGYFHMAKRSHYIYKVQ
ncbi:DUF4249 domain-containing protein [Flavobacterium sp. xlx-214]|uniref:DUF4249 domain-containing protein n=1 Tax=unclassified Flavobacterium TaxID=196869 RepID=UPI0013D68457|nr:MULTISPECIES: DUF4249 domain-containing protein [unclassified Flavobacterium]MBA5791795.1 DUF4249 domain-containing protein [Flavobacterium sp. xlx-221]QMI83033.1 DUF4249 domain-containing protein [Flavobacterium sp. xlx-214]